MYLSFEIQLIFFLNKISKTAGELRCTKARMLDLEQKHTSEKQKYDQKIQDVKRYAVRKTRQVYEAQFEKQVHII